MSDKDDIAARRKAERQRLQREHNANSAAADQQRRADNAAINFDAEQMREAFDILGIDAVSDVEKAAPYARTAADKQAIDQFLSEVKKGKRARTRKAKARARKAKPAFKRANAAKKKSGWGCAVVAIALAGGTLTIIGGSVAAVVHLA